MGKREEVRNLVIVLIIAICIIIFFNYGIRVSDTALGIIGAVVVAMIPSTLSYLKSNKISKIIKEFIVDQKEINEFIRHRKEIDTVCQTIERETTEIFGRFSEVSPILNDYVIQINGSIAGLIDKKYKYDLSQFDSEYFKSELLIKINQVSKDIGYVMTDKTVILKMNEKVIDNVNNYISELSIIKDLENGKRREKLKEETLKLTENIANHSIDIYNNKKTA